MVGDVLMSTLLCQHLKTSIENCQVHYLFHENAKAVVVGNPFVDKPLLFKSIYRKNKLEFFKFLKSLRQERYDAVIDVYGKLESNIISLTVRSPLKISYKKWYSSFIYDKTFKRADHPKSDLGDAIETRLALLNPIVENFHDRNVVPKIYLSQEEIEKAKSFLYRNGISSEKPFLIIGALGSSPLKTFPFESMAMLIDVIAEEYDTTLIFNSLPSQKNALDELIAQCSANAQRKIRSEIFIKDLRMFLAVLSLGKGYFGNEGGASNMARALGLPNFSIFSPWISKEAWLTDKSNTLNEAVHLSDFEPEILTVPKKVRKKKVEVFYERLNPNLILPKLKSFLKREVFTQQ